MHRDAQSMRIARTHASDPCGGLLSIRESRKGDVITGIPADDVDHMTFHAGTTMDGRVIKTSGGRVLCVVGLDHTTKGAQQKAYAHLDSIQFDGAQFRRDIGYRAL
jgi:phosphoribosylamine--glycine ligase